MIATDTKFHGADRILLDLRDGKRPTFSQVVHVTQFLEPITPLPEAEGEISVGHDEAYSLKHRFLDAYEKHMTFGGLRRLSDYSDLNMKESQELLGRMKDSVDKYGVASMTRKERMKLNGNAMTSAERQCAEAVDAHRNATTVSQVQTWMSSPRAF